MLGINSPLRHFMQMKYDAVCRFTHADDSPYDVER